MKVLNRPMFRYGGPIKEGIMSGIQEPRQRYQDAGQVFKNVQANLQEGQVADPLVLQEAAKLEIGNPYKVQDFKPYMRRVVTKPTDTSMDLATIGGYGEIEKPYLEFEKIPKYIDDIDGDGVRDLNPEYVKNKTFINDIFGGPYKRKTDKEFSPPIKTGKASGTDMPPMLDKSGKMGAVTPDVKLSGDDEPKVLSRKEKVNSILESLGYDRAQKNALYDAMIKAGQRISRTGLGAENLVSDVIAETSQSYDKPEKLREAANLMQAQQDLKLEQIEASKTNSTEEQVDFLMSAKGGNKSQTEALDIVLKNPRTDDEAYDKAYAQNKDSGRAVIAAVNFAVERDQYDKPLGIIDIKKYDNDPKKFFQDKDVYKGPGNYILGGSVIKIDEQGNATPIKKYYSSKKNEGFLAKFGFGGN